MRMYEGVILTKSTLDTEKREAMLQKVETVIAENNGKILKKDEWGKKKLAYLINKESEAHYVYMEFLADEAILKEMKRQMRINDAFLRHMFIKKDD